jgi:hypothetical protein
MSFEQQEHPEDICECGDYRKQHPDGGACALNGLGHAAPMPKGDCMSFRLALSYWGNYEIYDELVGVED